MTKKTKLRRRRTKRKNENGYLNRQSIAALVLALFSISCYFIFQSSSTGKANIDQKFEKRKLSDVASNATECNNIERFLAEESSFVRTDVPKHVPGFHVICATYENDEIHVKVYKNGVVAKPLLGKFPVTSSTPFTRFRSFMHRLIGFNLQVNDWDHQELRQEFRFFNVNTRQPIQSLEDIVEAGEVFLFEGGQWIWPGVRVGHIHQLPNLPGKTKGSSVLLETLSLQPLVFSVRDFLSEEECDFIIEKSKGLMQSSPVSLMDRDKGKAASNWRTSTQAWLHTHEHPEIQNLDHRVAVLTGTEVIQQEALQVLRYKVNEHYSAHLDAFDPESYKSNKEWFQHGHHNRLATVFWYMSDVAKGGQTYFPRANGLPQPMDAFSCEGGGLSVYPERGKVIIFYSLLPDGNFDENSLHGGCDVKEGKKWAANKWVWNKPRQ
eukprot:g5544.t1